MKIQTSKEFEWDTIFSRVKANKAEWAEVDERPVPRQANYLPK